MTAPITAEKACPQCALPVSTCPDPWQHLRDYRSSEWTWIRAARDSDKAVTR